MEHVPEGSKLSAAIEIENMVNSLSVGSSGYVVDTFVAAMWCLLTTDNYSVNVNEKVYQSLAKKFTTPLTN